jgi:hypothetical protein
MAQSTQEFIESLNKVKLKEFLQHSIKDDTLIVTTQYLTGSPKINYLTVINFENKDYDKLIEKLDYIITQQLKVPSFTIEADESFFPRGYHYEIIDNEGNGIGHLVNFDTGTVTV